MSSPAIVVQDLSKRYRASRQRTAYLTIRESITERVTGTRESAEEDRWFWALDGLSFEVAAGETIGIIGRNGAGKSTLLKVLARITEPTRGRATIRGTVGSLLEVGTGFHAELTGRENIFLNGSILGMPRSHIVTKLDQIVEFAGVERFLDLPVKRYSSGMTLRLAFSVAAHLEPEILLIDEVLAVGDLAFQRKCLGKMDEVAREGRTVLFVSHNLAVVRDLCSTSVVLDGGRLVFRGSVPDGLAKYAQLLESATVDESRHGDGWGEIWVESATDRASEIHAGAPFELGATLNLERPLAGGVLFCILEDGSGQTVLHDRVELAEVGHQVKAGLTTFRLKMPALWLAPDQYSLGFKVIGRDDLGQEVRAHSHRVLLEVNSEMAASTLASATLGPPIKWDWTTTPRPRPDRLDLPT